MGISQSGIIGALSARDRTSSSLENHELEHPERCRPSPLKEANATVPDLVGWTISASLCLSWRADVENVPYMFYM
jgi:hypothetical protein